MALRVYNTLTRQKEEFQTVRPGKVGMYLCGPTVYKPSHVGHMVGPVIFDTIKRFLVYLGYEATWVVNITDVDDKLIVQAQKDGTTVDELARRVTRDYLDCLAALGVDGIDHMPRATEHISEIIAINEALIGKGFAYESGGDVYFDVGKAAEYGKLSHRDPEDLLAGARILRQNGPDKKDEPVALVQLKPREARPRVFEGQVPKLPPGQYGIELVIPDLADKLQPSAAPPGPPNAAKSTRSMRATFTIKPPDSTEMPRSTTSRLIPREPACGSVRATTITSSALMPLVMNVLAPFSTQ